MAMSISERIVKERSIRGGLLAYLMLEDMIKMS